jgi:WD40 repeat protein
MDPSWKDFRDQCLKRRRLTYSSVTNVTISPNKRLLAAVDSQGGMHCWLLSSLSEVDNWNERQHAIWSMEQAHAGEALDCTFISDSHLLTTGTDALHLWELLWDGRQLEGRKVGEWHIPPSQGNLQHAFGSVLMRSVWKKSSPSPQVLVGCHTGDIVAFEVNTGLIARRYSGHFAPIVSIVADVNDENIFYSADTEGSVRMWSDKDSGSLSEEILKRWHEARCTSLSLSQDGSFLVAAGSRGFIYISHTQCPSSFFCSRWSAYSFSGTAFSSNGLVHAVDQNSHCLLTYTISMLLHSQTQTDALPQKADSLLNQTGAVLCATIPDTASLREVCLIAGNATSIAVIIDGQRTAFTLQA